MVVGALAPGQTRGAGADSDAGPSEHIRKENVKLRRGMNHLGALAAERRRVSKALTAAGALDDSGLFGSGRLIWPISVH